MFGYQRVKPGGRGGANCLPRKLRRKPFSS